MKGRNLDLKSRFGAEGINIQQEQNEETRIQKMKRGLGTSRILNVPTSESQGCLKKRKSKKLKTYLNK